MTRWASRARIILATSLWPVPAIGVVIAVLMGVALRWVDDVWLGAGGEPTSWLFGGDGSAARSILSTIATSMATITSLVFSLTIVTLQLASSQYTPRLLQTFSRDRTVQACLATLLGTFVFSLIVLRSVRSESTSATSVPRLSVTVAIALTLASIGALVAFIGHQVTQLRVETMLREVHDEGSRTVDRLERWRSDTQAQAPAPPTAPPHARRIRARSNGFLQRVEADALVSALVECDLVLVIEKRPGDPLISDTPIGWMWPLAPEADPAWDELEAMVDEHLIAGFERIDAEDPSYGLRKLVDVAVRSLSPGINDPTTAIHALSHISALLGEVGRLDAWHRALTDDEGTLRVFLRSWTFEDLMNLALDQSEHYGRNDSAVVGRIFELLAETAWRCRSERQRRAVDQHLHRLSELAKQQLPTGWSRADLDHHEDLVRQALG